MVAQRRRDTAPELALRRELHRRGLRYRLHRSVVPGSRRKVDLVFGPSRVAVEVRGCFWHRCPLHATSAKANAAWWADKLARNVERDAEGERLLATSGWKLVVVWEHELRTADGVTVAAERVEEAVTSRRTSQMRAKVES